MRNYRFVTAELLLEIYDRLYEAYGSQHWWPGDGALEIIVGAILTQTVSWRNVEKAIDNLRAAEILSVAGLRDIDTARLAELIRPAGYYNVKAKRLKTVIAFLLENYDGEVKRLLAREVPKLRDELLEVYGIGPETADSIILYAAEQPLFVVDAYTRRIMHRLGFTPDNASYDTLQAIFMDNLSPNTEMFNEYHALLVNLGKNVCRKRAPRCGECPIVDLCPSRQVYE